MPREKKAPTLLEVALRRVGLRKAYIALEFAVAWAIVEADLGRPPVTADEFGDWWQLSRSQSFRQQATFRETFPEFSTPSEMFAAVGVKVQGQDRERATGEVFAARWAT